MANIGGHWYLFLILLVVVLIIWGPGKLPDVGAGIGRAIREFRKASTETKDAFNMASTETPAPAPAPAPAATPAATPAVTAPAGGPVTEQPAAETPKHETPAST
jgi:TatA/E family protein of Tat protein translocase